MNKMEIWGIAQNKLNEAVGRDEYYMQALEECRQAEKDYLRVVESLPEEQREIIENYIAVCENLEFQRTRVAYFLPAAEADFSPGSEVSP